LNTPIEVAVAVIQDEIGRVLLTKRPEHVHQGGLWEFPGGKLEIGESVKDALLREINEELGIQILDHEPLIRLQHHYPEKTVVLDVHKVLSYEGYPEGMEGQPLVWATLDTLRNYAMPIADIPIINAISLPDRYLITGSDPSLTPQFLEKLDSVLAEGCRFLQLRAPVLDDASFGALAECVINKCHTSSSQVLLNCDPKMALSLAADGVHLSSERLLSLSERPLPKDKWVAASCHNPEQLGHAIKIDVDFVVLSPVCFTTSHPSAQLLGWDRFAELVKEAPIPVFALGGVGPEDIVRSKACGGQGIAAISALWPSS